jgi:transcription elongation factor Elf1
MSEPTLNCPECGSDQVTVTAEQMFMANTGDHYCHSVKTQDDDAKATCLDCRWEGERKDLVAAPTTGE